MKNFIYSNLVILSIILLIISNVHAQSITIADVQATPGSSVQVPVNTSGLTNVAVVKLYIYFDPDVLTYTGVSNIWSGASSTLVNYIPSQNLITTQFFSLSTGVNFIEGKYFDLNFTFIGGSSDLTFNQTLSKVQAYPDLAIIPTSFIDGSVFQPVITFNLTALLEGAYDPSLDGGMRTDLNTAGLIPLAQPFNQSNYYGNPDPSWLYNGTEQAVSIPPDAVDWVLVELRDAASVAQATEATRVAQKPCFLLNNGSIREVDGTTIPRFYHTIVNGAFIVIWHRNHLGIMSSAPIVGFGGAYAYNFTTGSNKVAGGSNGYMELEANVWGLVAGDTNADKFVNMDDKTNAWETDAATQGYNGSDLNLDTQADNPDKNDYLISNISKFSGIPN
jgi:hypothetical protein